MKIVHFTIDEKFINGALSTFEIAFPKQNELYVLKSKLSQNSKYINPIFITNEILKDSKTLLKCQAIVGQADWVIIHGMNEVWAKLILNIDTSNVIYFIWGAEIYNNPYLYKKDTLGIKTKSLKKQFFKVDLRMLTKHFLNSIGYKKYLSRQNSKKLIKLALSKVNNIGVLYDEEIQVYKENKILLQDLNILKFGYYPIEYFARQLKDDFPTGNNILVGNSSSYTNNHLEIFDILKGINYQKRKVIVPLSYGDSILRNYLLNKGIEIFKSNFTPILKFLPLTDYTKLIQSCNVVIMNHYRQQAVGNIVSSIYFGAKVFLNKENSAYLYLKNLGCFVYDIENDLNNQNDLIGLTMSQMRINKSLISNDINQRKLINHLNLFLTK
jgi:hypothetical protein